MSVEIQRTLQNLTPNTRYVVRVRAYNKLGVQSDWSEALDFTTGDDGSIPATPTGIYTTPGVQAIVIHWSRNKEVDFNHYELFASQTTGFTPDSTNQVYNARATSYSHPTQSGQHWFFRLRAVDVAGNASPFTQEFSDIPNFITNADIVVNTISARIIETSVLEADLTLSGSIKTGTTGARMELDAAGFRGYAADGTSILINYDAISGSLSVVGDITSGSTISGVTLIGSTISGSTFTAGNPVAGHIVIDSAGLRGYAVDGTTKTLEYKTSDGSVTLTGTLSGGVITGSSISSGVITGSSISGGTVSGADITGGTINIGPNKFVVPAGGTIFAYANVVFGLNYSGGVYFADAIGNADSNWGMQANSSGATQRNLLMYFPDTVNIREIGFWDSRLSRFTLYTNTFGDIISDANNVYKHTRNLSTGSPQGFVQHAIRLINTVSGPIGIAFDAQGDGVAAILNLDNPLGGVAIAARDSTDTSYIPMRASAFTVSSTIESKLKVRPLEDIGAKIDKLNPVRFKRPSVNKCSLCQDTGILTVDGPDGLKVGDKCPFGKRDRRSEAVKKTEDSDYFGVIAEEIAPIMPEVVTWEMSKDSTPTPKAAAVDYGALVAILVKEVQSLRKRVKQLEK